MNLAQHSLVLGIRIYRAVFSPVLATVFGPFGRCRFEPTCSVYAREAIETHGALLGTFLAIMRICRCNPFGGCGHDPVPPKSKVHGSRFKVRSSTFISGELTCSDLSPGSAGQHTKICSHGS